jgi:peptide/nickel transport system substrate-binding protein
MRKFYWYLTAYFKKHGFIIITSLVIGIIFFWFLLPPLVDSIAVSKRHYIGIIGESSLTNLPKDITNQLSLGLTVAASDGSIVPALAERWTIEQDGKTYRFVLKKNIIWQDGTPVSPSDIQYSFPDVETIITPNDIVFKLPSPFAPFPTSVSQPLLKQGTLKGPLFLSRPTLIGIGPYKISNYIKKGNRLKELVVDGNGERFIYRFYQTEDDAIIAFKRGEVDILPNLAREHDIYNWPSIDVTKSLNQNQYLALFFNTRDPLFSKSVRQALSYALEKQHNEERAIGPISPLSWAYLPGGKTYDKDWERGSERLLAEPPGQPLTFEITTTALFAQEAEAIKKTWQEFGQEVFENCQKSSAIKDKSVCENVKINPSIRINNFPDTSNFQTLLIGQEVPSDPDQYALWHSNESTNFTGYKNTRIDNLLEKGRQTYDQQERTEIYQEFQQFFLEDPPAIFLRYLWNYEAERKSKI